MQEDVKQITVPTCLAASIGVDEAAEEGNDVA